MASCELLVGDLRSRRPAGAISRRRSVTMDARRRYIASSTRLYDRFPTIATIANIDAFSFCLLIDSIPSHARTILRVVYTAYVNLRSTTHKYRSV